LLTHISHKFNFNGICEDGETSKNCRDDCRPKSLVVYYLIIIILLFSVSFLGVTLWYQRHREEILFGDRRQLFNLVNFIKSSQDKGIKDKEIEKMLLDKGWVQERITYAIEKARKVDGLTIASFNNFIDKKIYQNNATPQVRQQIPQKINKPNSQDMRRRQ